MRAIRIVLAALALALCAAPAFAAEVEVKMLNMGPGGAFVFEPLIVRINPGDFVKFAAVDRNHQVTSIRGGIPANAAPFQSSRNNDYTLEFTVPGVYAYECTAHRSLGMVGLVIVGNNTANLAAIRQVDLGAGLANQRLAALVRQAGG